MQYVQTKSRTYRTPSYTNIPSPSTVYVCFLVLILDMNGSVKEPNISIYFFFRPSLNGVLFPMFYLLVEEECQILVF